MKTTIARCSALLNNQPVISEAEMLLVASGQCSTLLLQNCICKTNIWKLHCKERSCRICQIAALNTAIIATWILSHTPSLASLRSRQGFTRLRITHNHVTNRTK